MNPQEYQIKKFLSQVDRNFHDYGDIDPNILFDLANAVRNLFVRFAEDKLDDSGLDQEIEDCKDDIARNKNSTKEAIEENKKYEATIKSLQEQLKLGSLTKDEYNDKIEDLKRDIEYNDEWIRKDGPKELKDYEDELRELTDLKAVAVGFIERVDDDSIRSKDKKILDTLFFNKGSQLYIDINEIADRFYLVNVADEFTWVADWAWIYLEDEYGIKNNADFVRAVLENKPIDLDIYNYFDEDSIKRLVKTPAGKKFLDHYFQPPKDVPSFIDQKYITIYIHLFLNRFFDDYYFEEYKDAYKKCVSLIKKYSLIYWEEMLRESRWAYNHPAEAKKLISQMNLYPELFEEKCIPELLKELKRQFKKEDF